MSIDKFKELLKAAYEQGHFNGHADALDGLPDDACAEDWLSEVLADGEIAGIEIPELSNLPK